MPNSSVCATAALLTVLAGAAAAQEPTDGMREGALAYRICAGCHSLQPGVHLSGPSLAGMWGRAAASASGFGRYTKALEGAGIIWDENTLNAWLAHPSEMVPGTTMTFAGIEDDQTRVNLIAFLEIAMSDGGAARVVAEGLVAQPVAAGQIPPTLGEAGPEQTVTDIRHCGDAFHVTTASGATYPIWETNVRLKIDTSARGPGPGMVVLLRSGMAGDRVSVVFASLAELSDRLAERC